MEEWLWSGRGLPGCERARGPAVGMSLLAWGQRGDEQGSQEGGPYWRTVAKKAFGFLPV